jgi:hypothetical protein
MDDIGQYKNINQDDCAMTHEALTSIAFCDFSYECMRIFMLTIGCLAVIAGLWAMLTGHGCDMEAMYYRHWDKGGSSGKRKASAKRMWQAYKAYIKGRIL